MKLFVKYLLYSGVFGGLMTVTAVSSVSAATGTAPVVVGYFSAEPKANFAEKVKPLFEKETHGCARCKILDLTPYDDKGLFKASALEQSLKDIPPEVKILFFDFNLKKAEVPSSVVDLLTKYSEQGPLVVASAGAPRGAEASCPLSKTVFGRVKDAFIIGELSERDRLMPQSFFGPEMLTAVRPPKEYQGQGFGPLLFTSKLASNYGRKSPQEWSDYIKNKKLKSRKIWPELEDFFN